MLDGFLSSLPAWTTSALLGCGLFKGENQFSIACYQAMLVRGRERERRKRRRKEQKEKNKMEEERKRAKRKGKKEQ